MPECIRKGGDAPWVTGWIVSNLNAALTTWNDKLGEIWQLLTQSPQTFKDGQVWAVMVGIHGALQAIGYGLLVLFFAAGVVKTCGTFVEAKRPEQALKLFIRFRTWQGCRDLRPGPDAGHFPDRAGDGLHGDQPIWRVRNERRYTAPRIWLTPSTRWAFGIPSALGCNSDRRAAHYRTILRDDPDRVWPDCIPFGCMRPLRPFRFRPLAGEPTSNVGKNFLRSYAGVCLQGVVIALACIIFSAVSSSPPAVDTSVSVVTAVWTYVGELAFTCWCWLAR